MRKFVSFLFIAIFILTVCAPCASAASHWEQIHSDWILVDENGVRQTGWQFTGNRWYYLDAEGIMKRGWFKDVDGSWYFLENSGAMKTGWLWDGNSWYHFNSSGRMSTGWIYTGGSWFYLRRNGAMVSDDVLLDGGRLYFLDGDGRMITDQIEIADETIPLRSDGSFDVVAALQKFSRKRVIGMYLAAEFSEKEEIAEKVAVTENGQRFHTEFCKTLEHSNVLIFSKNSAAELGYTPCKVCCP